MDEARADRSTPRWRAASSRLLQGPCPILSVSLFPERPIQIALVVSYLLLVAVLWTGFRARHTDPVVAFAYFALAAALANAFVTSNVSTVAGRYGLRMAVVPVLAATVVLARWVPSIWTRIAGTVDPGRRASSGSPGAGGSGVSHACCCDQATVG